MTSHIPHRATDSLSQPADAALFERVRRLAGVLPAIAQDAAVARRDAARLRRENATLKSRMCDLAGGELDASLDISR